ncbi:MAG TPA: AAA family ATPase [Solirubrobacteraceae bacterium]|nr:AAA family ATPase [Solirubrobacteraceae bacterium]
MRPRLTANHFVGRIGELAELELALHEASEGRPGVVLLGGESGIGKTRLVSEFASRAAHSDDGDAEAVVLRGEAVEQREGELPYAPLLSALRPLARAHHPALDELSPASISELATLLPPLARGDGRAPGGRNGGDPGSQLGLFEALLELLDLIGSKTPVAFVLEDMHWADRSTRALAAHLARNLRTERVVLVFTYRTDELHRRHPLRPLLAELERLECTRAIELERFDRRELTEVLTDILGEQPNEQLVERLFERSEGNPLYTEELLAAGLDGRGATPRTLRDAFMLRIERLPEDAQRVVRALAIARRMHEETIAAITSMEHAELTEALREAVSAQVLLTDEDDRFVFRHALLAEALYEDLLPGERSELHLALARVLEQQCSANRDAEAELTARIAYHYAAAGDQPAALTAMVNAARAAGRIHAYGEKADLAERALELWARVPNPQALAGLDHVELLSLAAGAHARTGDSARCEVLLQEGLRELDPESEPRRYSALLGSLARTQWALNRGEEGVRTAERALALLPADERTPERVLLLSWLARTRFLRGRFREAIRDAEEAHEAVLALGDGYGETEVLNTLGMTKIALGQVEEGEADLRRAIELARAKDDLEDLAYAYSNLADLLAIAGRVKEALSTAREGLAAVPSRMRDTHDWLMLTVSGLAFESGDWRLARAHLDPLPSRLDGRKLIFRLLRGAEQAMGEGDEESALRCLDETEPLVTASSEPQWIEGFGSLAAEVRRRRHQLEEARSAVADALDRIELCTDDVFRVARVTAIGMAVEADVAQRARDLREKAQEKDAVTRAQIHMDRLRAAAESGGRPVEGAWLAFGTAEYARARGKADPKAWITAAGEWDRLHRPYRAVIARLRAAEAYVEKDDRESAAQVAAGALKAARALGSNWLESELAGLVGRARLDVARPTVDGRRDGADGAQAPGGESDQDDVFGLTPRERQVLALLAEGATNRQIGNALYMAEKTASVHVSRILSKLGVRTRTQAAAVAHRQHLDQPAG